MQNRLGAKVRDLDLTDALLKTADVQIKPK